MIAATPRFSETLSSVVPVAGVVITLLGAFLTSLKSVATSTLLKERSPLGLKARDGTALRMSGLQLLLFVSPFALLQSVFFAWSTGEFNHIPSMSDLWSTLNKAENEEEQTSIFRSVAAVLFMDCLAAFLLNIASFEASQRVGALGITVAGNVKQVLILILETVASGEGWTWMQRVGVLATVVGSCWFVVEETREKGKVGETKLEEREPRGPKELEEGSTEE